MTRMINMSARAFLYRTTLIALLVIGACAHVPEESNFTSPSILNREKADFHNKSVNVKGWMRVEFENYSLWQSKRANSRGSFAKDCVSLIIPSSMNLERYNKRYVQIEGVFLKEMPKNFILLGGCNITAIMVSEGVEPSIVKARD